MESRFAFRSSLRERDKKNMEHYGGDYLQMKKCNLFKIKDKKLKIKKLWFNRVLKTYYEKLQVVFTLLLCHINFKTYVLYIKGKWGIVFK